MPFTPKLAFDGGRLRAKIEDPARDEAAQNGDVCDYYSDVVFDVVYAVVDWVGPVGLEEIVEPVVVREIDFCSANGCNTSSCKYKITTGIQLGCSR